MYINKIENKYINSLTELNVLNELYTYDFKLWQITKFNKINTFSLQKCIKLVCHLSFKDINFDKKKIVIFLFLLELLSSQKSCLIQSKSHNMFLKIRKGAPVSCKVTLRGNNMFEMFDTITLAFTRLPTRSFIKISKKIQKHGGRFFSYQMDSLERFLHLSTLTIGESSKSIDFCWVFTNHIWQESIFYLSSFKLPVNIFFKQTWDKQIKFEKNSFKNINTKKESFIKNETLFHLNRLFFILNKSNIILLVNKSTIKRLIDDKKLLFKYKSSINKEIKVSNKYLRLLNNFNNFPINKNHLSGDMTLLILNKNITGFELANIFNICLKSNEILPICFFYKKQFFSIKWFFDKFSIFIKNKNLNEYEIIHLNLSTIMYKLLMLLTLIKDSKETTIK